MIISAGLLIISYLSIYVNPAKAYFNCHTDITIPYDELEELAAVKADGERIAIIRDGRFVLPGTEELNEPFGA